MAAPSNWTFKFGGSYCGLIERDAQTYWGIQIPAYTRLYLGTYNVRGSLFRSWARGISLVLLIAAVSLPAISRRRWK